MGSNNRLHGKVMALENGRARIEGASWSLLLDDAIVQQQNTIRDGHRLILIVGDHQRRQAQLGDVRQPGDAVRRRVYGQQ
jgi:hypothetical protein